MWKNTGDFDKVVKLSCSYAKGEIQVRSTPKGPGTGDFSAGPNDSDPELLQGIKDYSSEISKQQNLKHVHIARKVRYKIWTCRDETLANTIAISLSVKNHAEPVLIQNLENKSVS